MTSTHAPSGTASYGWSWAFFALAWLAIFTDADPALSVGAVICAVVTTACTQILRAIAALRLARGDVQ